MRLVRGLLPVVLVATVSILPSSSTGYARPTVVLTVLADDMGYWDSSIFNPLSVTPTLRSLADAGVRLSRMYAYKYCSPSRRSFLSGRFPIHISGAQAPVCSDYLPLNFTLLSQKLQRAGMQNHFIGKGHLGYMTMDHLPVNRGFDSHVGFLYGAENYSHGDSHMNRYWTRDFWAGSRPAPAATIAADFYSTNFFTARAVAIIQDFAQSNAAIPMNSSSSVPPTGLWVHLCHQAVHAPITDVPAWERLQPAASVAGRFWDPIYADMLHVLDRSVANVTAALRAANLWNETLLIVRATD
eukprot:COSAG01_NODE_7430_length_3213_cov_2.737636_2_plen_298_part_00